MNKWTQSHGEVLRWYDSMVEAGGDKDVQPEEAPKGQKHPCSQGEGYTLTSVFNLYGTIN